ncbi:MAG: Lacal_2735 family protein [Flavobacteriales bacterium]|nr:Lacal_2735 family protein [Flavobacteriales bacterium]
MFNLFKKPSERERLEKVYKKLLEESFRLSTSNRKASDLKRAEAEEVLKRIEALPR